MNLNMSGSTQVVDFDKPKAFDKVLCASLLQILMFYGISQVFQSYFFNSQQPAALCEAKCEVLLIPGGVPQA